MKNKKLWLGILVMVFGMTVVGCATLTLGQPFAVGSWTVDMPEISLTGTYIINKDGSYSVTITVNRGTEDEKTIVDAETGSWKMWNNKLIIFTRSDTGQKYVGEIVFKKMIMESYVYNENSNSMTGGYRAMKDLTTYTKQ